MAWKAHAMCELALRRWSVSAGGMDVCVLCCAVKAKAQSRKKKQVWKKYKERTRELIQKSNPVFLLFVLYVSSDRRLCDGPIALPEDSYQLSYATVCDLETSTARRPWPALGCCTGGEK
jgi:hypothetical protein